jgi:hypothetical protein
VIKFLETYILAEIILVGLAVCASLWIRHRRKELRQQSVPKGYVPTEEVFTDPTTGVVQRVWFNPETGERFYHTVRRDDPHREPKDGA